VGRGGGEEVIWVPHNVYHMYMCTTCTCVPHVHVYHMGPCQAYARPMLGLCCMCMRLHVPGRTLESQTETRWAAWASYMGIARDTHLTRGRREGYAREHVHDRPRVDREAGATPTCNRAIRQQ